MRKLFILLLPLFLFSCIENKGNAVAMVEQWIGRKILFPNEMVFTRQTVDTLFQVLNQRHTYTIVNYVDSSGCTSCKMQLPRWNELITELNSLSQTGVSFLLILNPKKTSDAIYALKYNDFHYPVCIDLKNDFGILNQIPSDEMFQTFLLDKENKVLAIGNPVHNPKVKELYLKIIQGEKIGRGDENKVIRTKVAIDRTSVSLGSFDWQEEQKVTFILENVGDKPLVIQDVTTSCGCTTVTYPKEPVLPGREVALEVVYKAEYPEHFDKTITVYCNAETSLLVLKISGNAK